MTRIPVLDTPPGQEPAVFSAQQEPERLALLLAQGARTYTPPGLWFADARSRSWSGNIDSPYRPAVAAVDGAIGRRGAYLLNYSYEWGCTSGAVADPEAGGTTLLRTLDWPFTGLGQALIVVRQAGEAGPYLSVTWPGMVGVLSAVAPNRFAIAINQPPLPLPGWGKAVGWVAARFQVGRSRAMPATHLLRLVFDTCETFDQAAALIRATPVCYSAIFTLAGPEQGQALVIERTPNGANVPDQPAAANHWASPHSPPGNPRDATSRDRRVVMCGLLGQAPDWSLGWVQPPVLQWDTRLAMMANPCTGRLVVRGWEKDGPATEVLDVR